MSKAIDRRLLDGGPAFPPSEAYTHALEHADVSSARLMQGMSLRDWFAGQALAGLLSLNGPDFHDPLFACVAYQIADAMLRARFFQTPPTPGKEGQQ